MKQVTEALDAISNGGAAGKELIDYFQNADFKDIMIEKGSSNSERSGLISWNPTEQLSNFPNQDGSYGRSPFVGLAHEIGHTWDRWENGDVNTSTPWYKAADGTTVFQSEKIATWWENRIRAENGIGLRESYSFIYNNGVMQGETSGRLLVPGTRLSEHINIFGSQRQTISPFNLLNINYKY